MVSRSPGSANGKHPAPGRAQIPEAKVAEGQSVGSRIAARHFGEEAALRDILAHATKGNVPALAKSIEAILAGMSPDDAKRLRKALREPDGAEDAKDRQDEELAEDWREGGYPYKHLMMRKNYERQKYRLQVELLKLQAWVKDAGQRVVILFEGRDAAGKGGTIKRFMEHLNPRGARVMALQKPTDEERGQWYFQRYAVHLPTRGEMVLCARDGARTPAPGA